MDSLMTSSCSSNRKYISRHNAFNKASSFDFDKPESSSEKVHRVAMLKTRFADIILKAEKTLDNNGEKEDPTTIRQEKADCAQNQHKKKRGIESYKGIKVAQMPVEEENFVEEQQEKKRRIIARVKIPKATTDKRNFEHKMKIQKEREEARLALEKVEASVYIDDFSQTYRDFLMLIGSEPGGIK